MRIAFVSYDFPEYCIRHANEMAKSHDVLLALPLESSSTMDSLIDDRVQFTRLDRPRYRQPMKQLSLIRQIVGSVRDFQPDVVHFQNGHPYFNLALRQLKRYPIVITIHDATQHPGDKEARLTPQWLMDYGFRHADEVIVHGQTVADEVINRLGFSESKVHRIPHIAIGQDCQSYPNADDGRTVLFFGRIWGYKGLDYLIRSEPLVSAKIPNVRFVIAGRGEDFDVYRKQMVNPDRFEVHNDWITDEQRAQFFSEASIVALPYVEASQSGVVPLAYLHEKPVVVSRIGGLPDVVDHERTGLLVKPADEKELAEAIIRLLRDEPARKAMGLAGRHKLDTECSPPAVVEQTTQVYRTAMGAGLAADPAMGGVSTLVGRTSSTSGSNPHLERAAKTHGYLNRFLRDGVLSGPDPGVRFNYRIWRFLKSVSPDRDWGDDCTYMQTQGYWVLANLALHDQTSDKQFEETAVDACEGMVARQRNDGGWDYPNAEWAGRVATVEGIWASLALLKTFEQTGDSRFEKSALAWHEFFIDRIGFRTSDEDTLAVNYFADEQSDLVPNNSALALRYLSEFSRVTGDESFLSHCDGLVRFIAMAQLDSGEVPYAYNFPKMKHFQCFQYQSFTLIDLWHYYQVTKDPRAKAVIEKQAAFIQTGISETHEARYDCHSHNRFVNYHSAAVGAALVLASTLSQNESMFAQGHRVLAALERRQNADGSWPHSRGDYRVLSDRRKYPRYLSMILLHLMMVSQTDFTASVDTETKLHSAAKNAPVEMEARP